MQADTQIKVLLISRTYGSFGFRSHRLSSILTWWLASETSQPAVSVSTARASMHLGFAHAMVLISRSIIINMRNVLGSAAPKRLAALPCGKTGLEPRSVPISRVNIVRMHRKDSATRCLRADHSRIRRSATLGRLWTCLVQRIRRARLS